VPTGGLLALAPTLDAIGPIARTAADAALLFGVLAGTADEGAAPIAPLAGTRIGVLGGWFAAVLAADVAAAFDAAIRDLRALGAELVVVDVAVARHGPPLSWLITMAEAARTYAGTPRDLLSAAFRSRLEVGDRIDPTTYDAALRARRSLTAAVLDAIAGCDVVVTPTCVSTAPPVDDVDRPVAGVPATWPDVTARQVALWNLTGLPALSVPIGFGADGLPIGMQVVGPPWRDEGCLAVGAAFQAATGHHLCAPPSPKVER
jgi:aspartyl-tRNA(Asn)/glutamyl-tRNA(Gln) amidotransferase subunit A